MTIAKSHLRWRCYARWPARRRFGLGHGPITKVVDNAIRRGRHSGIIQPR